MLVKKIPSSIRDYKKYFQEKELQYVEVATFPTTFLSQINQQHSKHKNLLVCMWMFELWKINIDLKKKGKNIGI